VVPHYFNTEENLDYLGPFPYLSYCGVDKMSCGERKQLLSWYERQKVELFNNRRVLVSYSQNDVKVLRQAFRLFRRDFLHIGNIEVFLESLTIASACNNLLRRKFLKRDTIGLIRTGGKTCNNKYCKVIMWLFHMEQSDGWR